MFSSASEHDLRHALKDLDRSRLSHHFLVYNGYCPWMYGVPMNPTEVHHHRAWKLVKRLSDKSNREILEALTRDGPPPLQYAEEGDRYYEATGGNRFITFMDPEEAVTDSDKPPY